MKSTHTFIGDIRFMLAQEMRVPPGEDQARSIDSLQNLYLPELYNRAWKKNPRLHCSNDFVRRFRNAHDEHNALQEWVNEGLSPIIFFASKAERSEITKPALSKLMANGYKFSRKGLLGNLTPPQFTSFLRDGVALDLITYEQTLKIVQTIPEILTPQVYHNAQADPGLLGKAFWRGAEKGYYRQDKLSTWIPILLLTTGARDAEFFNARSAFHPNTLDSSKKMCRAALKHADSTQGHNALVRFLDLQYKDWSSFALDEELTLEFTQMSNSGILARIDFWIDKAVEVVRTLGDTAYLKWPAALYAACYHEHCNEDAHMTGEDRRAAHEMMLVKHPKLYEIQAYLKRNAGYPLEQALAGSDRVLDLMSLELTSFFNKGEKERYAQTISRAVANHLVIKVAHSSTGFSEPWSIARRLDEAEPHCAQVIQQFIHENYGLKQLDGYDDNTCKRLLYLMLRALMGDENRQAAIHWCEGNRSRKWKQEGMRILNLTPADVKLTARQQEEFLAEDLGL